MSSLRTTLSAACTREIVQSDLFSNEPLVLADVGCSGGISNYWRQFEPAFAAFGFDPLVKECDRLNRAEHNARVRYIDAFIGWKGYAELYPKDIEADPAQGWSNQPFSRTSAARMQKSAALPAAVHYNNADLELQYTTTRTSLDAFFAHRADTTVDFIKIDTDGHDYEVLCGARQILDAHKVLGMLVEVQFHGVSHPHANLFSNIDRLLRAHGFSLFDLEIYRYTRASLPGHFVYRLPGQTREGQVLAGDALYLRDIAAPAYEDRWGGPFTSTKLLKLICLFEIFGMPDCAAELLEQRHEQLAASVDVPKLLNALVSEMHPRIGSFAAVNRRFDEAPHRFYPRAPGRYLRRMLPSPVYRFLSSLRQRIRA